MLRGLTKWALLALAGTAAGCVRYVAQPLDPATAATRLTSAHLDGKVWNLEALVAQAVQHHPEVALARAQYETARAALITAGERPNPTIAISSQAPLRLTNYLTGTYGIDFDWTFETAGKRSRRLEMAHASTRAAASHLAGVIWKTRAAVRKALLELYAGEQRGRILQAAVAEQSELLAAFNQRVEAGAESRSNGVQIRLLQAQLRLQTAEAARASDAARASLAAALGMSADGLRRVQFSFAAFEHLREAPPRALSAALTHRAEVLAALAEYAAAESALRLEVARQYPDLHLNPGYQLDDRVQKWNVGIGLTLPILNQNQGAIGEAEAKRKEAAARFYSVQAKVLAEGDAAAVALKAARRKLAVTDEALAEQTRQTASEEVLLGAGAGDKLGLRSARVEQALAQVARLDSWVEYQAALGSFEEAMESPLP